MSAAKTSPKTPPRPTLEELRRVRNGTLRLLSGSPMPSQLTSRQWAEMAAAKLARDKLFSRPLAELAEFNEAVRAEEEHAEVARAKRVAEALAPLLADHRARKARPAPSVKRREPRAPKPRGPHPKVADDVWRAHFDECAGGRVSDVKRVDMLRDRGHVVNVKQVRGARRRLGIPPFSRALDR
jgi:hypothetical protein